MRRTPLKRTLPPDRSSEPGYRAWHAPLFGDCGVCGTPGLLLRHHVVLERHVREAGGEPWDLRNSLLIGAYCRCHRAHHGAACRIELAKLPDAALAFAVDLLGEQRTAAYLQRYYRP